MGASTLGSRAIIGRFYNRLEAEIGASWLGKIGMKFNSDQESETYPWLGMAPVMREWVGGRDARGFNENGITIINKIFEATLEVLVDDLRRDKTGQILIRVDEMAKRAVEHWAKLITTLITNGTGDTSGTAYDGQYFFDSDHSEGDSGSQLNLLTNSQVGALDVSTATTPTPLEAAKAILGVIAYMAGIKDDQGEPMMSGARSFLVMTSPILWQFLAPAVHNVTVLAGEQSPLDSLQKNSDFNVDVVINTRLAYTTQFVVFRTDAATKPFILQEEEGIRVSALAEGSDEEFKNNRHLYGVKAVRNVGYGYWQFAAHATLS